ncbi:hypothetical protein AB4Y32_37970 [Paraburkholderia phymatum]|uniref:Uncharacterized protein n=1 Tax=Paraburkholderia phymatum TaxID=148447 RepID=A0ACC6UD02_9BURK
MNITPVYAKESYDRSALILSQRNYVKADRLKNCKPNETVVVSSIPDHVGFLSDINLAKGIYVSLDLISVTPASYLAMVARVGTKRNLVTLNGVYLKGRPLKYLSKYGFDSDGEAGASIISQDGRYVAPNGKVSCVLDAYPGVWNIKLNRRVVTDEVTCNGLFLSK